MTSVYHRLDQGLSQYQIGELAWEGAVWDEKSPGGTTIELDRCPESLLRNALLRLRGLVLTDAVAFRNVLETKGRRTWTEKKIYSIASQHRSGIIPVWVFRNVQRREQFRLTNSGFQDVGKKALDELFRESISCSACWGWLVQLLTRHQSPHIRGDIGLDGAEFGFRQWYPPKGRPRFLRRRVVSAGTI